MANGVCTYVRRHTDPDDDCGEYVCELGACCYFDEPGVSTPGYQPQKEPLPLGPCTN